MIKLFALFLCYLFFFSIKVGSRNCLGLLKLCCQHSLCISNRKFKYLLVVSKGDSRFLKPPTAPRLEPFHRSHSLQDLTSDHLPQKPLTPPGSSCGHPNAGQELCYLCHQRARRNIPVYFKEERQRRDEEEERLLHQYQDMRDAEDLLKEQVGVAMTIIQLRLRGQVQQFWKSVFVLSNCFLFIQIVSLVGIHTKTIVSMENLLSKDMDFVYMCMCMWPQSPTSMIMMCTHNHPHV